MKRLIAILFITMLSFSNHASAKAALDIHIYLDSHLISFPDQKPLIVNNKTLVPVRFIAEAYGADVNWNNEDKSVDILFNEDTITLKIDSTEVRINNKTTINLDVPAQIISDRTMVPLRFISEAIGIHVSWDPSDRTVLLTSPAQKTQNTTEKWSRKRGNEIYNNNSSFASDGQWVYYCDSSANGSEQLSRYNLQNPENHEIVTDDRADCLNIWDNWIYYRNFSDAGRLYRVSVDGMKKELISSEPIGWLSIVGNYLYYTRNVNISENSWITNASLVRLNINNLHAKPYNIYAGPLEGNPQVFDGWIYFTSGDNWDLYKINTMGSDLTKIIEGKIFKFCLNEKWIFFSKYSNDQTLDIFKFPLTRGEEIKIIKDWNNSSLVTGDLKVVKDTIYFTHFSKDGGNGIYQMPINGANISLMASGDYVIDAIIDDTMFCFLHDNIKNALNKASDIYALSLDGITMERFTD